MGTMSKSYEAPVVAGCPFLAWLPLPLVTAFGALVASLITLVPLRYASAYRVVLINLLATHPDMSLAEARRIGRKAWRSLDVP